MNFKPNDDEKWIPLDFVCEMSNKLKGETSLPVNIWIDEAGHYLDGGHSKRIKFQLDKGDLMNHHLADMDFQGNIFPPEIGKNIQKNTDIKIRDVNQVRNFVRNNKYALERLADQDIWMYEIWSSMIMGGKVATQSQIDELNKKVDEIIASKKNANKKKSKKA